VGNWIPILIAASLVACAAPEARPPEAAMLPSVPVASLDEQPTDLRAVVAGRVSLVNLWASWCTACVAEQDALNRLSGLLSPNDAVVVGIAVGESRQQVMDFLRLHPSSYIQLVDEDFKFADALRRKRVPTTLVVDRAGRIVYAAGAVDASSLNAFRRALAEGTGRSLAMTP
jgi:thiol-disulfide isomerase/thioredoxin